MRELEKVITTLKNSRPLKWSWSGARFVREKAVQSRFKNQQRSLRYKRARIYSAQLGRFISRDPLGFVDGMNQYRAYFVPGGMDPEGTSFQNPYKYFHDLANQRRHKGPWKDSAQHCWGACYFEIVGCQGAGHIAACIADVAEYFYSSSDSWRDIRAQHYGALCGSTGGVAAGIFTRWRAASYCDWCCDTQCKKGAGGSW